jgi:hypothetical protein
MPTPYSRQSPGYRAGFWAEDMLQRVKQNNEEQSARENALARIHLIWKSFRMEC